MLQMLVSTHHNSALLPMHAKPTRARRLTCAAASTAWSCSRDPYACILEPAYHQLRLRFT